MKELSKGAKRLVPRSLQDPARKTWYALHRARQWPAATFHPWRRSSMHHLANIRNAYQGKRCFIIGNGPSLKKTDLSRLQGEYTFGMNRIYLLFPELGFTTTFFLSVNDLVIEQCAPDILALPIPKFLSWRSHDIIRPVLGKEGHIPEAPPLIFLHTTYTGPRFASWLPDHYFPGRGVIPEKEDLPGRGGTYQPEPVLRKQVVDCRPLGGHGPCELGDRVLTRRGAPLPADKIAWMSRWPLAVIIGVYVGLKTTGFAQSDLVAQVQASLQPVWTGGGWTSFNATLFTVGLISSLLFFFFSREHKGVLGGASRVGIVFLMVSFGAGYGYISQQYIDDYANALVAGLPEGSADTERCADGIDNNGDGRADCADPTCAQDPACQTSGTVQGEASPAAAIPDHAPTCSPGGIHGPVSSR